MKELELAPVIAPFLVDEDVYNATASMDALSARLSRLAISHDYHDNSGARRIELLDPAVLYSAILWRDPRPWVSLCFHETDAVEGELRRLLGAGLKNAHDGLWLGRNVAVTLHRGPGAVTACIVPSASKTEADKAISA